MHRVELKVLYQLINCSSNILFLMHRVELKGSPRPYTLQTPEEFLMHRVELKAWSFDWLLSVLSLFLMHRVELKVPYGLFSFQGSTVPNAPCGVESQIRCKPIHCQCKFLMHRVELKGQRNINHGTRSERFLMHRVELKVNLIAHLTASPTLFLMHRVELKVPYGLFSFQGSTVPNAPCGVESSAIYPLMDISNICS